MDWGEARASRFYVNEDSGAISTELKPIEPDVRTTQGSIGIQFNFWLEKNIFTAPRT